MRLRPICLCLSLLVVASFFNVLFAQTTTSGALAGVVTDPSQAVVADAVVEVKSGAKGTSQITRTDREGIYRFLFLAPGRYALTVTHGGFQQETRWVNVLLGSAVSANIRLALEKVKTN